MRFLARIVIAFVANLVAIILSSYVIQGFVVSEDIRSLLIIAGALTITNGIVRPVVKLIVSPLIILTLGLFSIVVNAALLSLLDFFIQSLTINGLPALIYATLLISFVNIVIHFAARRLR